LAIAKPSVAALLKTTLVNGVLLDAANNRAPENPSTGNVIAPSGVAPLKNVAVSDSTKKFSGCASKPKVDSGELRVNVTLLSPLLSRTGGVQLSVAGGQFHVKKSIGTSSRVIELLKDTVKPPPEMEV